MSLEKLLKAIRSRRTGLSVKNSYGQILAELLTEREMRPFAECTREWVLIDRSQVCGGDIRVIFVTSGLKNGIFCSALKDYDRAPNKIRIFRQTEHSETHEQRVYGSREFNAEKKR